MREQLLYRYIPHWNPILSFKGKSSSHLRIVIYICQALTCFTTKFSFKRNGINNCVLAWSNNFPQTLPHSMVPFFVSDCISTIAIVIVCKYVYMYGILCKCVKNRTEVYTHLYKWADSLCRLYGVIVIGNMCICMGICANLCKIVQKCVHRFVQLCKLFADRYRVLRSHSCWRLLYLPRRYNGPLWLLICPTNKTNKHTNKNIHMHSIWLY